MTERKRVAILISGRGTNMSALIARRGDGPTIRPRSCWCCRTVRMPAGLAKAAEAGIATAVVRSKDITDRAGLRGGASKSASRRRAIDIVCLAGFMRLLSEDFVERWRDRLINIHPSLLPAFRASTPTRGPSPPASSCTAARCISCAPRWMPGRSSRRRRCRCSPATRRTTLAARVLAAEHRIYPVALALVAAERTRVVGERVVIADLPPEARRVWRMLDSRRPTRSRGRRAMNYRHAFHAGGFADVVKHAVLALLIERLKQKDTAFRVIDTHAGTGLYDLASGEATRSGEWREGIGRLWQRDLPPALAALLAPCWRP